MRERHIHQLAQRPNAENSSALCTSSVRRETGVPQVERPRVENSARGVLWIIVGCRGTARKIQVMCRFRWDENASKPSIDCLCSGDYIGGFEQETEIIDSHS